MSEGPIKVGDWVRLRPGCSSPAVHVFRRFPLRVTLHSSSSPDGRVVVSNPRCLGRGWVVVDVADLEPVDPAEAELEDALLRMGGSS